MAVVEDYGDVVPISSFDKTIDRCPGRVLGIVNSILVLVFPSPTGSIVAIFFIS